MKSYSFSRCRVCDELKSNGVWEATDFICHTCNSSGKQAAWEIKDDEYKGSILDPDFDELEEFDLLEIERMGECEVYNSPDGEE